MVISCREKQIWFVEQNFICKSVLKHLRLMITLESWTKYVKKTYPRRHTWTQMAGNKRKFLLYRTTNKSSPLFSSHSNPWRQNEQGEKGPRCMVIFREEFCNSPWKTFQIPKHKKALFSSKRRTSSKETKWKVVSQDVYWRRLATWELYHATSERNFFTRHVLTWLQCRLFRIYRWDSLLLPSYNCYPGKELERLTGWVKRKSQF